VQTEINPSKKQPYRHPHYQESLQEINADRHQHYQRRGRNNHAYSWNMASHNNPRYQESLKERHEYQHQHYQRRGWNSEAYSWNRVPHNHLLNTKILNIE